MEDYAMERRILCFICSLPHDSVLSQRFGQGINHNQSRFSGPSDKYLLVACAKC